MPARWAWILRRHRRTYWLLCLSLLSFGAIAQTPIQFVADDDGSPLPFATVQTKLDTSLTDEGGYWTPKLGLGLTDTVRVSWVGFEQGAFTLENLIASGNKGVLSRSSSFLVSVVVAGRRETRVDRMTAAVEVIPGSTITTQQSLTTVDALANLSGAYVQQSQFGGGSPVLRGFEANRVLLVVDGVRMNNAIYRSGHLQNAITVDPLALSQLEVIYGAGSLAYGSDALGGVVHFKTREPKYRVKGIDPVITGEVISSFGTAANSLQFGGRLEYGGAKWAGLTILSTTQTSDLRAGSWRPEYPDFGLRNTFVDRRNGRDTVVQNDRPNVQIGTGYDQYNLLQKFRFQLAPELELGINLQASTSSDIPRYDALTELRNGQLRWARWDYGPQTRLLAALELKDRRKTALYDRVTYLLSQQFIEEDRIRRRFGDDWEENNEEEVFVSNLQVDFSKELPGNLTLKYGVDLRHDRVVSDAFLKNIVSGERDNLSLPTRYPSQGSSLSAAGAYLDMSQQLGRRWRLRGGLRLASQRLRATFGEDDPLEWPRAYLDGIRNDNTSATGAFGIRRNGERSNLRFVATQGFRAPNVDDFGKFRERNGFILIPNPELGAERSNTLEFGYEIFSSDRTLRVGATLYHTWLRNAIIREDGALPNGDDFFVSRGDTLRTQTNVNAISGNIAGGDFYFNWQFAEGWELDGDVHYIYGRRRQNFPELPNSIIVPQDHIPPAYGKLGIGYRKRRLRLNGNVRFQVAKPVWRYAVSSIVVPPGDSYNIGINLGTPDNIEFTPINPNTGEFVGSRAWWTLNVSGEYALTRSLRLRLRADNLLDCHYRTFASGVSAPGLDIRFGVSLRF
ncbi:TonB-dependent siderophore receptor [Lewinella sp. 4G2]|uniref:TonB-dependent receptor plug domain-containing protein n=1 Tax=Lewinella sp. 4G2 TaxID=1803372 RepID=UPI0007B4BB82|nr:TonB-dependent receptor [Lewinella sp. 4G2]OAV44868.1 hypothetical protein A3850_010360 [Lewinella sp. 4G2]